MKKILNLKRYFALLLILGMLLIPQTVLALEAFDITSYNVNMDVGLNNSYKITETIDVSFSEQRRGN